MTGYIDTPKDSRDFKAYMAFEDTPDIEIPEKLKLLFSRRLKSNYAEIVWRRRLPTLWKYSTTINAAYTRIFPSALFTATGTKKKAIPRV